MTMLITYIFLVVMLLSGCMNAPHAETIEDELVQTFGSYENACEATMTIIPNLHRKELPTELSREDRMQVLESLRRCVRYYDDEATEAMVESFKQRGFGGYLSVCDNKIKMALDGKEFFVYFSDMGLLTFHLYPTPDSVAEVIYTLKCCLEECKKRTNEAEKDLKDEGGAGSTEGRSIEGQQLVE